MYHDAIVGAKDAGKHGGGGSFAIGPGDQRGGRELAGQCVGRAAVQLLDDESRQSGATGTERAHRESRGLAGEDGGGESGSVHGSDCIAPAVMLRSWDRVAAMAPGRGP